MKKIFLLATLCQAMVCFSQPTIEWQRCFGGSNEESSAEIQKTSDGGYIMCGSSKSTDGDVDGLHISDPSTELYSDLWIIKIDGLGNLQWQRCLGGFSRDEAASIKETLDGGFVIAGYAYSNDGDVIDVVINEDGSTTNLYGEDIWVVKIDNTGNIQWQKCIGAGGDERAAEIELTNDGGYVIAGNSYKWNLQPDAVPDNHGRWDFWIIKLDSLGEIIWQKCFGGSEWDMCTEIALTDDGGFIACGYTESNDGDVVGWHFGEDSVGNLFPDFWVVKLDANGNLQWQKCLGGSKGDYGQSINVAENGNYLVAGTTYSYDGDVSGYHGTPPYGVIDMWVVKLDSSGNFIWQKCLGGSNYDGASTIIQSSEGYIVAGSTSSNDGDVSEGGFGEGDSWIVRLDFDGNIINQNVFGGADSEGVGSIHEIESGFIFLTGTESNDQDVSGNHGGRDFWVVKLSNDLTEVVHSLESSISIYPTMADKFVTIEFNNFNTPKPFRVFDISGKEVKVGIINTAKMTIDVEGLAPGVYSFKIEAEKPLSLKFIKS